MTLLADTPVLAPDQPLLDARVQLAQAIELSKGRASATSRGVVHVALAALQTVGPAPDRCSAAVQGFGKVGRSAARFLTEAGVRVVAVSDQYGAVHRSGGLDIAVLERHVDESGSVTGFPQGEELSDAALIELEVDLLDPAAVESVITAANAERIQARIIVEGANGPTTAEGDVILARNGGTVVPGTLANAGGVIVSYFEWVQGNQSYWWSEDDVESRFAERMMAAWTHVHTFARERCISLRQAATALAVERVAEAHLQRGLYP